MGKLPKGIAVALESPEKRALQVVRDAEDTIVPGLLAAGEARDMEQKHHGQFMNRSYIYSYMLLCGYDFKLGNLDM